MSDWYLVARQNNIKPLSIDSGGLVCYSRGDLFRVSIDLQKMTFLAKLPPIGTIGYLGNNFRLLDRVFRVGPNHAMVIESDLYISRKSEIWRCNLSTGAINLDFVIPDGRRALQFGYAHLGGGEKELIFGEYFRNPFRKPVRIWGRSNQNGSWSIRGEFPANEIEHIHAVTTIDNQIFILCGDFDQAASIWMTDSNFCSIKLLLRGKQEYRAAWIAKMGERFFYATDTQLEPNHVQEIFFKSQKVSTSELALIDGSSIYCGMAVDRHFFSTTVECGMPTGNFLRDVFESKRGPGILSSRAKIMSLSADGVCEEIFSAEKDFLPFRLGQFGTFTFPTGVMPDNLIVAYGIALSDYDDSCLVMRRRG